MTPSIIFTEHLNELVTLQYFKISRLPHEKFDTSKATQETYQFSGEDNSDAVKKAPIVYDNYMRVHLPATMYLRTLAVGKYSNPLKNGKLDHSPAPKSLESYADNLVNFLNYLAEHDILLKNMRFEHVQEYCTKMLNGLYSTRGNQKRLSSSTVKTRGKTATHFGNYCKTTGVSQDFEIGYIDFVSINKGITSMSGETVKVSAFDLPKSRSEQTYALPVSLPIKSKLDQAITVIEDTEKPWVSLAAEMMYKSGLRISETFSGVFQSSLMTARKAGGLMELEVLGKGSKHRLIEMPIELYQRLIILVESYPIEYQRGDRPVLLNMLKNGDVREINYYTLWQRMNERLFPVVRNLTGSDLSIHPHLLRHIYAGDLFLEGMGLCRPLTTKSVRAALGGSSFLVDVDVERGGLVVSRAIDRVRRRLGHTRKTAETTQIYIQWAEELYRAAMNAEGYSNGK